MQLKRVYDMPEGWTPEYEGLAEFEQAINQVPMADEMRATMVAQFRANATLLNAPKVIGFDVVDTGLRPEQEFSREFVERGLDEGWFSRNREQLTLHTQSQGDLHFTILRGPGYYCCHCEERLEDDPTGVLLKAHVARAHGDAPSPDPARPFGYRLNNGYECALQKEDHDIWNIHAQTAKLREAFLQRHEQSSQRQGQGSPSQMPTAEDDGR